MVREVTRESSGSHIPAIQLELVMRDVESVESTSILRVLISHAGLRDLMHVTKASLPNFRKVRVTHFEVGVFGEIDSVRGVFHKVEVAANDRKGVRGEIVFESSNLLGAEFGIVPRRKINSVSSTVRAIVVGEVEFRDLPIND